MRRTIWSLVVSTKAGVGNAEYKCGSKAGKKKGMDGSSTTNRDIVRVHNIFESMTEGLFFERERERESTRIHR